MVSVAFPFFSFFLIKSSIHASVDESDNKETQYKLIQPKEKRYQLMQIPMEERSAFFEPEMLHTLPCKWETKSYLMIELNTNKE